jgi:hypothetical protein
MPDLEKLNQWRDSFEEWRDEGRRALQQFLEQKHGAWKGKPVPWNFDNEEDLGERALIVRTLCYPNMGNSKLLEKAVGKIRDLKAEDVLGKGDDNSPLFANDYPDLVFFDSARALGALASAPKGAFSSVSMFFYYVVVRELYYATPPAWAVGGARAGPGGPQSAYATALLVRGVLTFSRMLRRTGEYVGALADLQQPSTASEAWNDQDRQRRALSLKTTLEFLSWNLAFPLEKAVPPKLDESNVKALHRFEREIRHDLIRSLESSIDLFQEACKKVERFRKQEEKHAERKRANPDRDLRKRMIARSAGAHAIAFEALTDAVLRATAARRIFPDGLPPADEELSAESEKQFVEHLRKLKEHFSHAADQVQKLLEPAKRYLSVVLDSELAKTELTSGPTFAFEPAELASAAAAYGAISEAWDDERIAQAGRHLSNVLMPSGFSIGRPFHFSRGGTYQPAQPQILAAFAQIMEKSADLEVTPSVVRRIERYFRDTRRPIETVDGASSWLAQHGRIGGEHSAFHTALSTLAMDRIVRMLDRRINEIVLRHLPSKRPAGPKLHELFYPDYGLCHDSPRQSVAVTLERMRAHVAGIKLTDTEYRDPLCAVVLHGPPGTGKTTLIEALATSAQVQLVEITPGDIIVRGTEAVEASARAVLKALSMLTHVVILFDEFDGVLRSREIGKGEQPSTFTFLTAGMLTKLKTLYEQAQRRHTAYALVTNIVSAIDAAAIRGGRFDLLVGVYPPDVLSRIGRLSCEAKAYLLDEKARNLKRTATPPSKDRISTVILKTRDAPMQQIGRRDWFTAPKKGFPARPGTIFDYLFAKGSIPAVEHTRWFDDELLSEDESRAKNKLKEFEERIDEVRAWPDLTWDKIEKDLAGKLPLSRTGAIPRKQPARTRNR